MTCQAITQKVMANLFNYKTNILKVFPALYSKIILFFFYS